MQIPEHACAQMLEAHPDAHWLLDEAGVLMLVNRAAHRLMGRSGESLLGVNIASLVADSSERCADLIRQGRRSTSPTPSRLRLRTSGDNELLCRCEIALLSPATEGSPALLWCRLQPQTEGNSKFKELNQQIDALRNEVGRRQAAESGLRQQREWLQTVLQGITEGVIATDLGGCVLLVNQVAGELTGWPPDQAHSRQITEILQTTGERNAETMSAAVQAVLQGAGGEGFNDRWLLADRVGAERMVQISASTLMNEAGQPCGAVFVLRSVDSEVRAERLRLALEHQLRHSQKMEAIGTLAGGVAHDFNNVIGAVIANAALARMELPSQHTAQQPLSHIQRAGDRARNLVRQILAFSRRDPQNLQRHWLQPLVNEAVGLLRGTLPARVRLDVQCAAEPLYAFVDATQFQQVVMNLCTNAWHALPPDGGDVKLSLGRRQLPWPSDDNYPGRWKRGVKWVAQVVERAFRWAGASPC